MELRFAAKQLINPRLHPDKDQDEKEIFVSVQHL